MLCTAEPACASSLRWSQPVSSCLYAWHSLTLLITLVCGRYAWAAISQWQVAQGVTQQGLMGSRPQEQVAASALRRSQSTQCMTQLQAKQPTPSPRSSQAPRQALLGCGGNQWALSSHSTGHACRTAAAALRSWSAGKHRLDA